MSTTRDPKFEPFDQAITKKHADPPRIDKDTHSKLDLHAFLNAPSFGYIPAATVTPIATTPTTAITTPKPKGYDEVIPDTVPNEMEYNFFVHSTEAFLLKTFYRNLMMNDYDRSPVNRTLKIESDQEIKDMALIYQGTLYDSFERINGQDIIHMTERYADSVRNPDAKRIEVDLTTQTVTDLTTYSPRTDLGLEFCAFIKANMP